MENIPSDTPMCSCPILLTDELVEKSRFDLCSGLFLLDAIKKRLRAAEKEFNSSIDIAIDDSMRLCCLSSKTYVINVLCIHEFDLA